MTSGKKPPKILVLGVGNPILSDDGVGFHVAAEVEKRLRNVDVKKASLAGLNLLELILDYDAVIIVDAFKPQGNLGDIKRFDLAELPRGASVSSHDIELIEALELGFKLFKNRIPRNVIIYTVEAEDTSTFSDKLTLKVQRAVPTVVDLISNEIEELS